MVAAACVLPCRGVRSVTLECESDGYAKIFRWSRGGCDRNASICCDRAND
jgi:hypothetical protein